MRPIPPSIGAYDKSASRFDFNGDFKDDLLWENGTTGQHEVWYMNGQSVLTDSNIFATVAPPWKIKGVADINGDGHPNCRGGTRGQAKCSLEMTGASGTTELAGGSVFGAVPSPWQPVSMADFNSDGHPDILFENMTTGQLVVWYMNGETIKSEGSAFATLPANWRVADGGLQSRRPPGYVARKHRDRADCGLVHGRDRRNDDRVRRCRVRDCPDCLAYSQHWRHERQRLSGLTWHNHRPANTRLADGRNFGYDDRIRGRGFVEYAADQLEYRRGAVEIATSRDHDSRCGSM